MSANEEHGDLHRWLADMNANLKHFLGALPATISKDLDFSPESLEVIEKWILARYANTQMMLASTDAWVVDGLARYIGETFRKTFGGRWEIRLDDPKYVFYGKPQLSGFWDRSTPMCPESLATASADRRTGRFLTDVLTNYFKKRPGKAG